MGCYGSNSRSPKRTAKIQSLNQLIVVSGTFVAMNEKPFEQVYYLGKITTTSGLAEIREATHRVTEEKRAVKIIRKVHTPYIANELHVIRKLDHPNILRTIEIFEDHHKFDIVMEYCPCGGLFEEVIKRKHFTEKQAATILKEVLSVVSYMHEQNIVHRDLKPECIFLENLGEGVNVKVSGFGSAVFYTKNTPITGFFGTAYYVAPEVILGSYTEKCDIWSCGVILYILLSGTSPFSGDSNAEILGKVQKGVYSFPSEDWNSISDQAKSLIECLLCPESVRLSALQALDHEWIQMHAIPTNITAETMNRVLANLSGFHSSHKLRDAVQTYVVSQCIASADEKELRGVFLQLDTDGTGTLSRNELFVEYTKFLGETEAEKVVNKIMSEVDTDHSGFIDYTEFLKAAIDTRRAMSMENLKKAFDLFDKDSSGTISLAELKKVLENGNECDDRVWRDIIKEVDENGDGEIDLYEFEGIVLRNL